MKVSLEYLPQYTYLNGEVTPVFHRWALRVALDEHNNRCAKFVVKPTPRFIRQFVKEYKRDRGL